MAALSDPVNVKPRVCAASARICPMTPPCDTTATVSSGWAVAMRVTAPRTRAANTSAGSAPGMTSQRCSANIWSATGWPSATWRRKLPPSHSPRCTSRRSASTRGSMPSRAARGAAVCTVRRSVLT
jgi:hypothetical protein